MSLKIKPADQCQFDQISLGEIMLRLDPGEGRIRTAREFKVWEGGGEYNVARGLRKCFGLRTAVCTAFVDNEVGHLIEDFIMQGGVATDFILWRADDGIGRSVRNGLNFTERGFGIRGAVGVSDRGNTAASQLKPGDFDWDTSSASSACAGSTPAASSPPSPRRPPPSTIEAVKAAQQHGTIVCYDLNYRPSLWKSIGGQKKAREVNREIAKYVDVMIGNEEDFTASLGFEVEGVDHNISQDRDRRLQGHDREGRGRIPELQGRRHHAPQGHHRDRRTTGARSAGTTASSTRAASIRSSRSSTASAAATASPAACIYGFLETNDPQKAVDYGAAHGALAMTTPGDTSMATRKEVEKTMGGGSARVVR